MKRLALSILLLLCFTACGRKGALVPPEALVPAAVQDLNVRQSGGEFRIVWSAPTREKGGRPLRDLSGFRLYRRSVTGDRNDCSSCQDSWKLLTTIDSDMPGQGGPDFNYQDKGLPIGSSSQYRLLAVSRSGGISSPATSAVKKLQPVLAPPGLNGVVQPSAIRLEFNASPDVSARSVGFNVYRRLPGNEFPALPLNAEPIRQRTWEDRQLEFGRTYGYRATVLLELEGEIVESLPSENIELLFSLQELR